MYFMEEMKIVAIIQEHSKGILKSGREFKIIDLKKMAFSDDGTIHSGTLGVVIDGEYGIYPVSVIAENIDYEKFNNQSNH